MQNRRNREIARKHIDKKLQRRLRIYFVIALILVGVVLYEVFRGLVGLPLALLGILIGLVSGILSSRMFHISWDQDVAKVVSKLDMFGVVILIAYVIFALFRSRIVGYFVHGSAAAGVSFSMATGLMIGRLLGTRGRIMQILKEQNVF